MRISRIYIKQPLTLHESICIEGARAHYLIKVLRAKVGREVILFNGDGGEYRSILSEVNKKSLIVDVNGFNDVQCESPLSIELGCCLIKNDRMDWLLQKATELGVSSFSPLLSEYTDVNIPLDRLKKKLDHWEQVVISACEQSGRTRVPRVALPQRLNVWLESSQADKKMVLHPYGANPLCRREDIDAINSIALLVGPEGGLTDDELLLARHHCFSSISLGPRILRAETAPLAALSLLQHEFGDFSS